jgi:hypothetical protein
MRIVAMFACNIVAAAGLFAVMYGDFVVGSLTLCFGGLAFLIVAPKHQEVKK